MKIATITIYCDEWFRLSAWKDLYNEYKDEVYVHIIINNGKLEDNIMLSEHFPKSHIIYSTSKNMTYSYNLGVKEALKYKDVEAIMQVTNDIRLKKGTISNLYKKLLNDDELAVIGPVILKKDSNIIESFGYKLNNYYGNSIPLYRGLNYEQLDEDFKYVSCVPGGATMIKRSSYEIFGYQDENLHMYCDERDMFIRFDKLGFKEGVLCTAKAWHQHIYKPGTVTRNTMATFLTARNRMYITSKHNNRLITFVEFLKSYLKYSVNFLKHSIRRVESVKFDKAAIRGLWAGYIGNMNNRL